jgi:hypothetical protein
MAPVKSMETRLILDWFVQAFAGATEAVDSHSGLPVRREVVRHGSAVIDPTPDEIRAATLEIQAEWTDGERSVRAGGSGGIERWRVPRVRVVGLPAEEE